MFEEKSFFEACTRKDLKVLALVSVLLPCTLIYLSVQEQLFSRKNNDLAKVKVASKLAAPHLWSVEEYLELRQTSMMERFYENN